MENDFCKHFLQIKSNTLDGCYKNNDKCIPYNQVCNFFKKPCYVRPTPCLSTINKCHACLPFPRPFHPQQYNFKYCRYFCVNPCMKSFVRPPDYLANISYSTEKQSYYNAKPIERLNGDGIKGNSYQISKNILTHGKNYNDYGNNILTSNIPECIANGTDSKFGQNLKGSSKSRQHGGTGSYLNKGTSLQGGIGSVNLHGDIFGVNLPGGLETGSMQGSGIRTSKGSSISNLPTGTRGLLNGGIGTAAVPNYGVCEKSKDNGKIDLCNKNAQEHYLSTNCDKVDKIDCLDKNEVTLPVTCNQIFNEGNCDRPAVLLSEMVRCGEETKDINSAIPVPVVDESNISKGTDFSEITDKKSRDQLKKKIKKSKDFLLGSSAKGGKLLTRNKLPNKSQDNKNVRSKRIWGSLLSKSNIANEFIGNYPKKLLNTVCRNTRYCPSYFNIDKCKTNTCSLNPNFYISNPNPYLSNSKPFFSNPKPCFSNTKPCFPSSNANPCLSSPNPCLSSPNPCLSSPNPCLSSTNPCLSNPNSYACCPIQNMCQPMLCGFNR